MRFHSGIVIGLLYVVACMAYFKIKVDRTHVARTRSSKSPFGEKLLRPPGEGLRIKLAEVEERIYHYLFIFVFCVMAPFVILMVLPNPFPAALSYQLPILVISGIAFRHFALRLTKLQVEYSNYRLGFDGERYVANELTPLIARGYSIFHDLVFDMKPGGDATTFNIDHIAVGPEGVFTIETKTRRKPKSQSPIGQPNHVVVFDGNCLRFPSGFEDRLSIVQAQCAANDLSHWLTGSKKEPVKVTPVIAIPGWMVERKAMGPVHILSAKELAKNLPHLGTSSLTSQQVREIADRIEAKCRDLDVTS